MRSRYSVISGLAAALLLGAAPAQAIYSDPTPFARPGYTSTQLWDINNSGTIVGSSDGEGFVYSGGTFTTITHPAGTLGTSITGIASDGTLVGTYSFGNPSLPTFMSFIYDGSTFTDFVVPGGDYVTLRRISPNGRYLSGTYDDSTGNFFGFGYDRVTGTRIDTGGGANYFGTIAQGATNAGVIAGSFLRVAADGFSVERGGFLLDMTTGIRTDYLSIGGVAGPYFRDINESGVITGTFNTLRQAFVGTVSGSVQLFAPAAAGGSSFGYGLNDTGSLIGWDGDSTGAVTGWISTQVPEPGTWLLMTLGLMAVVPRRRR